MAPTLQHSSAPSGGWGWSEDMNRIKYQLLSYHRPKNKNKKKNYC